MCLKCFGGYTLRCNTQDNLVFGGYNSRDMGSMACTIHWIWSWVRFTLAIERVADEIPTECYFTTVSEATSKCGMLFFF